jgi:threonine/homoserine/homoserine lactone efflux protein
MGAALGEILGFAVGVAISPVPIIAVILMLFSAKAGANGISFVAGWLIGLLFLFLAWKQWTGRPQGDEEPAMPPWMGSINDFTAGKSFGVAFLLAAVNPKNLGLTVAAATVITTAGLETGEEIVVLVVFVLLASLTVAVPVIWYLIAGSSAEEKLNAMKDWLIGNNNTVMAVLFAVLGAKVLGDGISIVL